MSFIKDLIFGKPKSDVPRETIARRRIEKVEQYIGPISYNDFQSHVLPIITDKEDVKNRKIYHDSKLPSFVQREFMDLERKSK